MFKKNIAVTGFTFGLINASDGTAVTSGTVSGFVTQDGGTQTALTNSAAHEGNGQWSVNLTAGEMNGDVVGLVFTHTSAIPVYFTIRTVTKLVADLVDLTAAQVNAEVDTALSDYDGPTKAEMDAKIDALNDPSAAEIVAEMDSNSTQLAAIVADTNELQTDDVPGLIAGLNDLSPTDIDARLAAYDPPTKAELDAAIAGLNDISPAQVNAEVDTALTDIHLNRLFAADYDPASKPGTATALLNELIENDGGISRFSANALEEAPTGGGGASLTQQDVRDSLKLAPSAGAPAVGSIDAHLDDIWADTDELQTDDVPTLIAGLNDVSAADVKAQADAALTDIHLDHVFAADYDPASKPGVATALLNELVENDSGVSRFTANALEEGPSGGAGAGLTAQEVRDAMKLAPSAGAAVAGSIDQHLDDIEADTDELQGDDVPSLIAGLNDLSAAQVNAEVDTALGDYDGPTKAEMDAKIDALNDPSAADIRAEMDSNSTQLAAIVADTNELQTDDVPGLIAGLNDISPAQVNAEVDTALTDIHLNRLFAADYDPASKPGVATALLNELVEDDSGVSRFTANALEEGPSGGGSSGTGARTVTVTVEDLYNSSLIQNATVRLSAAGMQDEVAITNVNGVAELHVDDATWNVVVTANGGYTSASESLVVNGNESLTVQLASVGLSASLNPAICVVAVRFFKGGFPVENAVIKAEFVDKNMTTENTELSHDPVIRTTDANGYADLELIQIGQFTNNSSGKYRITITHPGAQRPSFAKVVTVPNKINAWLEDLPAV